MSCIGICMTHFVYVIENMLDGKKYVGYTKDPTARWKEHQANSRRKRCRAHLHRALASYGIDNFEFRVIAECSTQEEGFELEKAWIQRLGTFGKNGYNMTSGGEGCPNIIISDEQRKRMSERNRGRSPWNKGRKLGPGKKHTEESRRKMSEAKRGASFSEEHRQLLSEAWKERKLRGHGLGKRVRKHDPVTGDVIEEFSSLSNAAKSVDGNLTSITNAVKSQKAVYGFKWSLAGKQSQDCELPFDHAKKDSSSQLQHSNNAAR